MVGCFCDYSSFLCRFAYKSLSSDIEKGNYRNIISAIAIPLLLALGVYLYTKDNPLGYGCVSVALAGLGLEVYRYAKPKEEYRIFRQVENLAQQLKEEFTDEKARHFLAAVTELNGLFQDEIIRRHSLRICPGNDGNWKNFLRYKGLKREWVRLHELFEILSLKWDCGLDFDDPIGHHFWPAHKKAIQVENAFLVVKARCLNYQLSYRALEYMRFVDECSLRGICNQGDIRNIAYAIEILTKNIESMPTMEELEQHVAFFEQYSSADGSKNLALKPMAWNRFIFSTLYEKIQTPSQKILTLTLMHYCDIYEIYHNYSPKKILHALEQSLAVALEDRQMREFEKEYGLSDLMKDISNKNLKYVPRVIKSTIEQLRKDLDSC